MTDTERLLLSRIEVDPTLQPRISGIDAGHVRVLEESPEAWTPVAVVYRGGRYLLIDGFHRVAAAQNLGLESIAVAVIDTPEGGDLRAAAFALNAKHGRPLSLDDRRAEAIRLLSRDPQIANMEISRRVALSPSTVQVLRERLEQSRVIDPADVRVGRDGSTYTPVSTRRPGELPPPGFSEVFTNSVGRLFTSAERIQQRNITSYLQRLATALDDLENLDGWETDEDAANACRAVLGPEKAKALALRLGCGSRAVLDVATALGYVDAEADS